MERDTGVEPATFSFGNVALNKLWPLQTPWHSQLAAPFDVFGPCLWAGWITPVWDLLSRTENETS